MIWILSADGPADRGSQGGQFLHFKMLNFASKKHDFCPKHSEFLRTLSTRRTAFESQISQMISTTSNWRIFISYWNGLLLLDFSLNNHWCCAKQSRYFWWQLMTCVQNRWISDEFCIKDDEFCIENRYLREEFAPFGHVTEAKVINFALKVVNFALEVVNCALKVVNFALKPHEFCINNDEFHRWSSTAVAVKVSNCIHIFNAKSIIFNAEIHHFGRR